jgi:Xaa-Pro aminopeptidase
MDRERIQKALKEAALDGWLFYDFHNRDPIAYKVLGLDFGKFTSRRWFYYIPAEGEPVRLVSKVEPAKLDELPGEKRFYLAWTELHETLRSILGSAPQAIAMQYSPMNAIPYVSTVDAGTVELVESMGHNVVSSADLVQLFEAVLNDKAYQSHVEASRLIYAIKDEAFKFIETGLQKNGTVTEFDVQQFIVRRFDESGLDCMNEFPIVGINDHPANPHFEPTGENAYTIKKGDTILIDLWAKLKKPGAVFADITWCGFAGSHPPEKYERIFGAVRDARNAALAFVEDRFSRGQACHGWEVDEACRNVVKQAGFGDFFIHRTGHSIGQNVHGNGVHIDNLETKDERMLIPGICFSIEPGIYLSGEMAVRTEIDVFITPDGKVTVQGEPQTRLVLLSVK